MLEGLAEVLDLSEAALAGAVLVFMRIGAIMALLPGFGEQAIPMRVRLGLTVAFTMVVWPLLAPDLMVVDPARPFVAMMLIEAGVGLLFGLSIRLLVMALQFAGAIAAQSTSLAQIFGPNATPDPMPAMGNILMLAGVTLAVAAGLHVKAAIAIAHSYAVLPMGVPVAGADIAAWGVARVAQAFALGLSLAAPFVIASFAYNLALGAINRAMPQLMVAFVGAPAITAGGILILLLAAPVILQVWTGRMDATLADPFGLFP